MRINKKIVFYSSIALIFGAISFSYAMVAENIWNPKNAKADKAIEIAGADNIEVSSAPSSVSGSESLGAEKSASLENNAAFDAAAVNVPITVPMDSPAVTDAAASEYPIHKNISTTFFWAGEEADEDNKNISNLPSAWDEDWVKHFGGVDSPKKRAGFAPAGFTPKENPFYFALPYNDFNEKGKQKNDPAALAMWAKGKKFGAEESMCKNQWIRITKDGKTAYAQWEDVGPFGEDDKSYVFGSAAPHSKENEHAGLDVSPAVHDYLSLEDIDKTDWQFVDAEDVPAGPWKNIVTSSQVYWR